MDAKLDCRYYLGEKPCKHKRLCVDCPEYIPMGIRVLIIKLGAIGDALRTTPILQALTRKYPKNHVTWITDTESFPILEGNPLIDKLLNMDTSDIIQVFGQEFDLMLSLDKAPSAIATATRVKATIRRGYVMSPWGTLDIFNDASRYSLMLGLDDDLKFNRNQKTYQETIYEIAELPYRRDPYVYHLDRAVKNTGRELVSSMPVKGSGPKIGFNTGCGPVFATKKWPDDHFVALGKLLSDKLDARIYLLGGGTEKIANDQIAANVGNHAVNIGIHPIKYFAGILADLDIVVTSDTMGMHLALAVSTPVVTLFGPTCHQEIDLYDCGEKIVSETDCTPCYRSHCDRNVSCMEEISAGHVFNTISSVLDRMDSH
jgi:ADP-heptose:LPS heptosyltransferase